MPRTVRQIEKLDLAQRRVVAEAERQRVLESGGLQVEIQLSLSDARDLDWIPSESVHLVVTSPPYWTLKEYNEHPDQLGAVADYEAFLDELDKVWTHALRVLVPGGRLICVVGDVLPLQATLRAARCDASSFGYFC